MKIFVIVMFVIGCICAGICLYAAWNATRTANRIERNNRAH